MQFSSPAFWAAEALGRERKFLLKRFSSMMTCNIPMAKAPSVPGRIATHFIFGFDVTVTGSTGSTTTILQPRLRAYAEYFPSVCIGKFASPGAVHDEFAIAQICVEIMFATVCLSGCNVMALFADICMFVAIDRAKGIGKARLKIFS